MSFKDSKIGHKYRSLNPPKYNLEYNVTLDHVKKQLVTQNTLAQTNAKAGKGNGPKGDRKKDKGKKVRPITIANRPIGHRRRARADGRYFFFGLLFGLL